MYNPNQFRGAQQSTQQGGGLANRIGSRINWNPHSKWSGAGRLVQAVPFARRAAEKFVSMGHGGQYSDGNSPLDTFSEIKSIPDLRSGDMIKELQRHKLITEGYKKELDLVDKVEAGEAKSSPEYIKAKAIINKALKRVKPQSLKSNREFSLKTLQDPQNERMYANLSMLYDYCDNK